MTVRTRQRRPPDLEALADAYRMHPSPELRNRLVEALAVPADRDWTPRGPDPTATTAVARVDRERKSR